MIDLIDTGLSDYRTVYDLQKRILFKRQLGLVPDTVILTEHPPVFTMGRRGSKNNLLVDENYLKRLGLELIETERGGDVTFHGPGQLVLYPIVDLKERGRGIHSYIRMLEEVMIDFLLQYNVRGIRIPGRTGVWIDRDVKIGSIGIAIKKWIAYHGLSININTDLGYFDMVNPCGLGCRMASLSSILNRTIDMDQAKACLLESFMGTFTYATTNYK